VKATGAVEELARARSFAVWAHGDQKYGELPYVWHLDAVVGVATALQAPHIVRVAGYLHDVVEDTDVSIAAIEELFGQEMAKLVAAVTNEREGNRAERHARTYPKIRAVGANAIALKLADRIANVSSCLVPGPGRLLAMYAREQAGFRQALYREGEDATPHELKGWAMLAAVWARTEFGGSVQ
jgi:(p)ppGpp synthase/HD superfamily hydrolase